MLARLVFGALFGAVIALGAPRIAQAEVPSGGAYITTLPAGADIWVDGTYVGRSPVFVDALARGRHSITITKTGWSVRETVVEVAPGAVALSSTTLVPGPRAMAGKARGMLALRGIPSGAQISLDGQAFAGDLQKAVELPAGTHRITIVTGRGKTTRTFMVFPDTATQVVLHEAPRGDSHSAVVAPVNDYLPESAYSLEGKKIVVRYGGHVVVAHIGERNVRFDGAEFAYDSTPQQIGRKLYLPLELLEKLSTEAPRPVPSR
jgi:hypothetical protein